MNIYLEQKEAPYRDVRIAPMILRLLSITMIFTTIAAALEWDYLTETASMSDIERIAIIVAAASFVLIFTALLVVGGNHLNLITAAVGAGGNLYIYVMICAALFADARPDHAIHTGLWLHPLFVVFTLTRSKLQAQIICWGNILILGLLTHRRLCIFLSRPRH